MAEPANICFGDSGLEIIEEKNGVLKLGYKDANVTYSWDSTKTYSLAEFSRQSNLHYDTKCLRIPLDETGEATVLITTEHESFVKQTKFSYGIMEKPLLFRVFFYVFCYSVGHKILCQFIERGF